MEETFCLQCGMVLLKITKYLVLNRSSNISAEAFAFKFMVGSLFPPGTLGGIRLTLVQLKLCFW